MRRGSIFKNCQCRDESGRRVKSCKKAHGSWAYRLDIGRNADSGSRRQALRSGFRTREAAQESLNKELASLGAGTWTDDKRISVADWLTSWLDSIDGVLEPRTVANYRTHIRDVWVPQIGHLRLRDLRRAHVEDVLRELSKPIKDRREGNIGRRVAVRKPTTLDAYRRTLRAALSAGVRHGLIQINVAEGRIDAIPRIGRAKKAIWEPEDTAQFLEHVASERLVALFELAAYAGLRRAELCGLRWADVDDDKLGLNVRQTLVEMSSKDIPSALRSCRTCGREHKGRLFKPPKSEAGERWVPLATPALAALEKHRVDQDSEHEVFGADYADHDLVFAAPDGDPLRPGDVTRLFERHAKACGVPVIELHAMRHGACSLLLAGGVPIEVVQMILGHSSPEVTRNIYRHIMKKITAEQVRTAVELLSRHRQKPAERMSSRQEGGRPRPGANQTGTGTPSALSEDGRPPV